MGGDGVAERPAHHAPAEPTSTFANRPTTTTTLPGGRPPQAGRVHALVGPHQEGVRTLSRPVDQIATIFSLHQICADPLKTLIFLYGNKKATLAFLNDDSFQKLGP